MSWATALPSTFMYRTWTASPALRSATVMDLPAFLMAVLARLRQDEAGRAGHEHDCFHEC